MGFEVRKFLDLRNLGALMFGFYIYLVFWIRGELIEGGD